MKKIIILLLVIAALITTGIFFKDTILKFYNSSGAFQNLQNIDIGSIVSKVEKQILAPAPLKINGTSNQVTLLKSKIISETNLQRQLNGNLPPLKENAKLDQSALAKANDMFARQYFEHVSPTGIDPGKLVQNYGYDYIIAGENLILGNFSSEKDVVQYWMDSPGHRANILNNRYTEIGVAVIKGTYKGESVWISVQEFGLPLSTCSEPSVSLKNQIDSEKSQLDVLNQQINEKKNQIDSAAKNSAAYNQMVNDYNELVREYNALADKIKMEVAQYNNQVNNFNNCVTGNK
jgi:uncharacterized protein YkwD